MASTPTAGWTDEPAHRSDQPAHRFDRPDQGAARRSGRDRHRDRRHASALHRMVKAERPRTSSAEPPRGSTREGSAREPVDPRDRRSRDPPSGASGDRGLPSAPVDPPSGSVAMGARPPAIGASRPPPVDPPCGATAVGRTRAEPRSGGHRRHGRADRLRGIVGRPPRPDTRTPRRHWWPFPPVPAAVAGQRPWAIAVFAILMALGASSRGRPRRRRPSVVALVGHVARAFESPVVDLEEQPAVVRLCAPVRG